jgi:hypothetical protein
MKVHIFVLTALVVVSTALVGVAAAAPNNSTTTGDGGVNLPEQKDEYVGHVGNSVHIVSAELQNGEWVVVLEADTVARVTVQDPTHAMNRLSDSGTGNFNPGAETRQVTVTANGQTTVRLEAGEYDDGRAIYVLANGDGWYESTGMSNNPLEYFGGESGLMTGFGVSVVGAIVAAAYVARQQNKAVEVAD